MGKKIRKTRWRALDIANGEQSDSEESNATGGSTVSKNYQHKSYYSKYTFSSQSTPTRRYGHDIKSTRSSSTASETKVTFNEDEYTRITTPRQDVLFKKGYLNKPKNYQTQTSTGTSTTSTGNSTGHGTPDHQSADGTEGTDLEYESQFVFPNGYVDQNGFYYVNGYEPYSVVVYNAPICYPEYPNDRSKRYSTGSLTESTSPNNEETSQSGGEMANNVPEYGPVYNVMYPNFFYNGGCAQAGIVNGQNPSETRRLKKKKRRKPSKTRTPHDGTTSDYTDDYESSEEVARINGSEASVQDKPIANGIDNSGNQTTHDGENAAQTLLMRSLTKENCTEVENLPKEEENQIPHSVQYENGCDVIESDENGRTEASRTRDESNEPNDSPTVETVEPTIDRTHQEQIESEVKQCNGEAEPAKFDLKPDAQEFIPKAYRQFEQMPIEQNVQFVNFPPNFLPIPVMTPMGDLAHIPNYPPPFLPPGIPINFVPPPNAKVLPNIVNIVPDPNFIRKAPELAQANVNPTETVINEAPVQNDPPERPPEQILNVENADANPIFVSPSENVRPRINHKTDIDIAKIVSKLEEAAKEQRSNENKRQNFNRNNKYNKYRYPDKNPESPHRNNFRQNGNAEEKYKTRNGYYNRRPLEDRNRRNFESPSRYNRYNGDISKPNADEHVTRESPVEDVTEKAAEITTSQNQHKSKEEQEASPPTTERVCVEPPQPSRLSHRDLSTRRRAPNYSDTVKNSAHNAFKKYEKIEKHQAEKPQRLQLETPNGAAPKVATPQKQAKPANQWISVSSRKKRKNKGALENEEAEEFLDVQEDEAESNDLFESYDVNQLVDVVPVTKLQEETETNGASEEVKEISTPDDGSNTQKIVEVEEAKPRSAVTSQQIVMADVRDIERSLLEQSQAETEAAAKESQVNINDTPNTLKLETPEAEVSIKSSASRKTKKNVQKQPIKRIIITDTYTAISENKPEPLPIQVAPVSKPTKIDEAAKPTAEVEKAKPVVVEESAEPVVEEDMEAPTAASTPEKKNKKKKKRISKAVLTKNHSVSSSNTTINNFDDTYDFLLENSILDDAEDRTNVEISQELDRMIQKGMYNNLEEKIKSMNIGALSDGFFNSLQSSEKSLENSGLLKNPDLSSLVKSTAHLFNKPKKYEIQDFNRVNVDFSNIKLPKAEPPQPSTSKTGIFVENPEVNEILKNVCADLPSLQVPDVEVEPKKSKSNGKLKNKSKKDNSKAEERKKANQIEKSSAKNEENVKATEEVEEPAEKIEIGQAEAKSEEKNSNLYPITQAVKEWMTKTRENTPEIEILKSPRTIYKEFCESEKSQEEPDQKPAEQADSTNDKANDEEITLFSAENWSMSRESSLEQDLLDCWDNNAVLPADQSEPAIADVGSAGKSNGLTNGHSVDAEEDSIEVYESKYGKNEDYLKIKAEMEEKKATSGNLPRHGNLPYRAICCSVM